LKRNTTDHCFPAGFFSGNGIDALPVTWSRLQHVSFSGRRQDILGMNPRTGFFARVPAFDNFFYSNRPLTVVPSFSLYTFDGPFRQRPNHGLTGQCVLRVSRFRLANDPNQIIPAPELGVSCRFLRGFDTFNSTAIVDGQRVGVLSDWTPSSNESKRVFIISTARA